MKLAGVVAVACACGTPEPPSRIELVDAAVQRGAMFLATRQHTDGAFRSRTYSALRDGWSLTPLATLALRMAPQHPTVATAYTRGVDFTARIVDGESVREAPEVSYPLYAYALGALVLGAPDNARHHGRRRVLLATLRDYQLGERNGWRPGDPSIGGWGYARAIPQRPGGEVTDDLLTANLSATLLAVGALALGGVAPGDPALVAARGFVDRCHNADGGFIFSPALADANKAGPAAAGGFRSYGSMTADGLRALLRLGATRDDPRVVATAAYLDRVFDATRNPGDFDAQSEIRRESSYYYWAWSAAHAARHLDRRQWAEALADELVARQRIDGSWSNPATEMREDDPVIATAFAIAALAVARSVIADERRSHAY